MECYRTDDERLFACVCVCFRLNWSCWLVAGCDIPALASRCAGCCTTSFDGEHEHVGGFFSVPLSTFKASTHPPPWLVDVYFIEAPQIRLRVCTNNYIRTQKRARSRRISVHRHWRTLYPQYIRICL